MNRARASVRGAGPRCAIYTRAVGAVGLKEERRALRQQRLVAAAFVAARQGWRLLVQRYDDGGCAGSHLDRPALERLLADLDKGRIDVVLATSLDRLATSLFRAVRLIERFESAGAVFYVAAPVVVRLHPALPRRRGDVQLLFPKGPL